MSHILPDNLFQELAAGLVKGVPNLLNTEIPSEEVAILLTTNFFLLANYQSEITMGEYAVPRDSTSWDWFTNDTALQ